MKLDYRPIDYRTWCLGNEARGGVNIKRLGLLNQGETRLFDYFSTKNGIIKQDLRDDPGQAEIVTYFTIILLPYSPGSIREIAVPSAICHDTGWEMEDPTSWKKLVYSMTPEEVAEKKEELRRAHQEKGGDNVIISTKAVNYPAKRYRKEIEEIVRDHDTRYNEPTPSSRAMMDGDILWRFTMACMISSKYPGENSLWPRVPRYINFQTANPIREVMDSPERILKYMQKDELEIVDNNGRPNRFYIPESYKIARIELVNTIFNLFSDKAENLLRKDFSSELEQVVEFYKK